MAIPQQRRVAALRASDEATASPATAPSAAVEDARRVLTQQAQTLLDLASRVDERFADAVEILRMTDGHVIVTGVGKSGQIGRKIASTLASTGTPAFFVNAAEAHHGDLGMFTGRDTAILISHSGETDEVVGIVPHLRAMGVPVIAMVGRVESTLARAADVLLEVSVAREACPNNLAPTSSALAVLAMGDALAISLMRVRQFTSNDFARFHPGGSLGRQLTPRVRDVMRTSDLPLVAPTTTVGDSLETMTAGRLGLLLVTQGDRLVGLVTDGDLRRGMHLHDDVMSVPVSEIMTRNPVAITEDTPLADAHQRMRSLKLKALVVIDAGGRVVGVVEVFDQGQGPEGT